MFKHLINFFDNLEDKIRIFLSSKPILYAAIASVGTVLLWRGVWLTADSFSISGPISIIAGAIILLLCGLFVSGFIGNRILLTGMRKEKKLAEKTIDEIEADFDSEKKMFQGIKKSLAHIEQEVESLKNTKDD